MSSPLESYRAFHHEIRDLAERQRLVQGDAVAASRELEKMLEPMRQLNALFQSEILRNVNLGMASPLSSPVLAILASEQSFSALIGRSLTSSLRNLVGETSIETLARVTETGLPKPKEWELLAGIPQVSGLTEAHLRVTEFSRLAGLLEPSESVRKDLRLSLEALTNSFARLSDFGDRPGREVDSLLVLRTESAREVLFASHLAAAVTAGGSFEFAEHSSLEIEEVAADAPEVDELLQELDPDLSKLLEGAEEARTSKNPDRVRHVSTSLRELTTQLLHRLAPDDKVREWSSDPSHFDKKRPTRRARLLYIVRAVNAGPLSDFVSADVDSTLEFLDLFQEGTHAVRSGITAVQLLALKVRAEGLVRYLLMVARAGGRAGQQ